MSNQSASLETKIRPVPSPFATGVCLPALLQAQNADGGWGYRAGAASRVEPTSWAIVATCKVDDREMQNAAKRGRKWLQAAQQGDGLWTPHPGLQGGSWVTASACLALLDDPEFNGVVKRGAEALCGFQPRENGVGWKFGSLLQRPKHIDQDFSLHGWSWITGTVSWVIPTALAMKLLVMLPLVIFPRQAKERLSAAEDMLLARACPGGGWNCGNPMVYGVAGEALHEPTAWALLALQHRRDRPEVQRAVRWLKDTQVETHGATSLALCGLCLELYEGHSAHTEEQLEASWEATRFLGNVSSMAFATIALLPGRDRLRWRRERDEP